MMEINLNDFSKAGLMEIIDAARSSQEFLPDDVLAYLLRIDLTRRAVDIQKEAKSLGKCIEEESRKISFRSPEKRRDAYNKRVDRYNGLAKRFSAYVSKIQELEKAYPELKKTASGQ